MARPLRIDNPDGWHHAMNRGTERKAIFSGDFDRKRFVKLVSELPERFGFEVHAYCLMTNHYHLALRTPLGNLSRGMKWLGQSYSSWFNHRNSRVGPLFQGRFKSIPVDPQEWLYKLSLYIHLNPLRTDAFGLGKRANRNERLGVAPQPSTGEISGRLRELRAYRWSSYRAYGGYERTPEWLRTDVVTTRGARNAKDQVKAYRDDVRNQLKLGLDETVFERFQNAVALGSASFIERIRKRAAKPDREVENRWRLKQTVPFESVIRAVERLRKEPAVKWLRRHGDHGKWLALWLAQRHCGMTQKELGEKMGGMDYSAVSDGVRRYEKRMASNRGLNAEMKQAADILNLET